jgi:hypothetical protein
MAFRIRFNEEKNQLLKATRGICFDNVIVAIKEGRLLADIHHPNLKRSNQKIYAIIIEEYVYAVPYVKNKERKEIFLKTVYPSRALTKKYIKGGKHEKTKNK